MEFQLLGPVSVTGGSGPLPLGPAKRRSLLAALLLRAGTPVTVDFLTEALWDVEPPLHARTVIQGHVSRLRALLVEAGLDAYGVELATQGRAYALQLPETLLDARRFEDLVTLAGRQRDPADAALMLREALALWQGPALTGTVATPPLLAAAAALEESRLATVEQLARTYGQLGAHAQAVALLSAEVVAKPLREPLVACLMRALYGSGLQSDALGHYHRTRRLLADEMGVDPGPALREAYEEILNGGGSGSSGRSGGGAGSVVPPPEPAADEPAAAAAPESAGPTVPHQLPRPPRGFTGRTDELAALGRTLDAQADTPIALVTGPAGVGKTSFALHWSHRHADAFPDGQLFANLRGHSGTEPTEPARVLREFLLALGVRAQAIPGSTEAAAALYRSLVADRRLLVVLDNALDSAQVRPLLPGGPDCTTLVTSRTRLDGLIASDWARPVPLDVLTEADGARLLVRALGADAETAAEDTVVREVVRLCDGLPLALRIAAARVSGRRHWTVAGLAAELADEQERLAVLSAEDRGVAKALSGSVARLPEGDARLLAALARGFTRETEVYAAAALAAVPVAAARAGLDRLAAAHLLQEEAPGRYTLHDLVRLYARGLEGPDEPEATRRLVDHWLRAAHAAVNAIDTTGYRGIPLPDGCEPGLPVPEFRDRDAARRWFAVEQDGVVGAVFAAAGLGDDERTWRLAALLWPLVLWRPHPGWQAPLEAGLTAAERTGNREGTARMRSTTGVLLMEIGQFALAEEHFEHSLGTYRELLPELAAQVLVLIGIARNRLNDPEAALDSLVDARRTVLDAGHATAPMLDHHVQAQLALNQGKLLEAAEHAERALAAVPANETAGWRPLIWESYGIALHRAGLHHEARVALLAALAATEEEDLPTRTARALTHLGDIAAVLEGPAVEEEYRRRAEQVRNGIPDARAQPRPLP
ncbi:BTAD domain-containing putative transcriptional regulator [Streptomyces sp. NPDC059009]|uniref:AfsR/SARP family transcriptional regulator n=1 Tax=Streptomyces sp. NPDC059009 TaxID=3346694 RepID=UPI00368DAE29